MGRKAKNRKKHDGKTLPELVLPLTEARCEKLAARKPPVEDDECTWRDGFQIIWTKQGKIRFRYRFKLGKSCTISCGEWQPGGTTVADAVAKHSAYRQQVASGVDPRGAALKRVSVKHTDPAAPWQPLPVDERELKDVTVRQVLDELFHTCPDSRWNPTTTACYKSSRGCIEKTFGHRLVRTLVREEVQSLLLQVSYDPDTPGKRLWGRLSNVQRLFSVVLGWAVDRHVIDVNWARVSIPTHLKKSDADHRDDVMRGDLQALRAHERAILYAYLHDPRAALSKNAHDGLLVQLLTGMRGIDLTRMPVGCRTTHKSGAIAWDCPGYMFKMGLPWLLFPDFEVAEILTAREEAARAAGKDYLWHSNRAARGHSNNALLGTALEQIQGHPRFPLPILRVQVAEVDFDNYRIDPNYLRRGFRTGLAELDISEPVAEACMAHQRKKHYQKHDHALQKRDAWAAYADAIREDAASVDLDALIEVYKKSDAFKSNNERYRKQLSDTWKCRKRKLAARAAEVNEDDAA